MNRVYKIVWSKAKNAYVVTSELAKNHTERFGKNGENSADSSCGDGSPHGRLYG